MRNGAPPLAIGSQQTAFALPAAGTEMMNPAVMSAAMTNMMAANTANMANMANLAVFQQQGMQAAVPPHPEQDQQAGVPLMAAVPSFGSAGSFTDLLPHDNGEPSAKRAKYQQQVESQGSAVADGALSRLPSAGTAEMLVGMGMPEEQVPATQVD